MQYIDYITHFIYDISSTLYDVTYTICVTSHNDPIYGIKHYKFIIYSLDMASGTVVWPHNHCVPSQPLCLTLHSIYFWHYTQCTNFMKRSECMSSQPLYVWHHMHYIWHHIHYIWHHIDTTSTLLMISLQIYLWGLILYICRHHIHCIQQHIHYIFPSQPLYLCLTPTLSMISHRLYIWHFTQYMFIIRYTI